MYFMYNLHYKDSEKIQSCSAQQCRLTIKISFNCVNFFHNREENKNKYLKKLYQLILNQKKLLVFYTLDNPCMFTHFILQCTRKYLGQQHCPKYVIQKPENVILTPLTPAGKLIGPEELKLHPWHSRGTESLQYGTFQSNLCKSSQHCHDLGYFVFNGCHFLKTTRK